MEQPPVLDDWNGYVFPEGSLSTQNQRMMVRDPLAPPESDVYTPARLDTPQDRIPNTMMNTLVAVTEQLRDPHATAKFALSGSDVNHDDVNWFLFSPYEIFLEQVLAERLKTVEIGELK